VRRATKRFETAVDDVPSEHGVPLFLQQLVDTLRMEQATDARATNGSDVTPSPSAIGRAAALHGAELLNHGFSIDQVVHEYGDVCQSVTELAIEQGEHISIDEFRTLNRCLDDAIADAVTSYGVAREARGNNLVESSHSDREAFSEECRRLVDVAKQAFSAIRTGNVGLTGATGSLLTHALNALGALVDRELPRRQRG